MVALVSLAQAQESVSSVLTRHFSLPGSDVASFSRAALRFLFARASTFYGLPEYQQVIFVCLNLGVHGPRHDSRMIRFIAASLGTYMLMMYFAASLTTSKILPASCQSSEHIPSVRDQRNMIRAKSPSPSAVANCASRGKRVRDAAPKAARFCSTCLIAKPPR